MFGQTDLQIAALGWLAQQRLFEQLIEGPHGDRLRTLRSDRFLADPSLVFERASAFFGMHDDRSAPVRNVDVFRRNSKTGMAFDGQDRALEYRKATDRYGDEIERVALWARKVAEANNISLELTNLL